MSRKTTTFTAADGRDAGKRFLVTEMSAARSEEWAARALFAVMGAGVEIPDEALSMGMAGVAAVGLKSLAKVPFEQAKPLLNEMMTCVQFQYDAGQAVGARALIDDDIEEIATRLQIRKVVLDLHLEGFFGAVQSKQATGTAAATTGA